MLLSRLRGVVCVVSQLRVFAHADRGDVRVGHFRYIFSRALGSGRGHDHCVASSAVVRPCRPHVAREGMAYASREPIQLGSVLASDVLLRRRARDRMVPC